MRILFIFLLFTFTSSMTCPKGIFAKDILKKSIDYHDPKGILLKKCVTLHLTETRPNGSDRKTEIIFNLKKERFEMRQQVDGRSITSTYNRGQIDFEVDGSDNFPDEVRTKYRLTGERLTMLKDYYQYLWLMPMKLNDPGTNLNPLVKRVDFFGKESLEIRVTYDPDVGGDVWYFYFNPDTYALQGYRFYHDEEKNDGEYIILDGEVEFGDVRLPKERKWYTHKEDKFLGADILDQFSY